jgi:hypothetical protein
MLMFTAARPPFMKNGFVLGCERTNSAVVIDPGDEVDELLGVIRDRRLEVSAILLTHAHVDHVSGVAAAARALGAPVWLHRDDLPLYEQAVAHGRIFGLNVEPPPPVDRFYEGDGVWGRFGDYEVAVHHTPGHCPGGVCLAVSRVAEPAKGPAFDIPAEPLTGWTVSLWRALRAQDRYAVPAQDVRSCGRPHSGPSTMAHRVLHFVCCTRDLRASARATRGSYGR